MSERKAKSKKTEEILVNTKKKKTKFEIISNISLNVALVAILGVGVWAVTSHYQANKAVEGTPVVENADNGQQANPTDAEQEIPTLAKYCEQEGTTPEAFAKEYGLELGKDVTVDTLMSDAVNKLTLANYAKMAKMDVATIRQQLNVPADIKDTDIMMDVFTKISEMQAQQQTEENPQAGEADAN